MGVKYRLCGKVDQKCELDYDKRWALDEKDYKEKKMGAEQIVEKMGEKYRLC